MTEEGRRPGRPRADSMETPTADRILEVAGRLFMELGFDGVSTDEVARQTGITKAMIYYYFSSKTGLFTASMERMMRSIQGKTAAILHHDEPLYNRLLEIAEIRLSISASRHDLDAVLRTSRSALSDEQLGRIKAAEEQLVQVVIDAFQKGIEDKEVGDYSPTMLAHVYISALSAGDSHKLREDYEKRDPKRIAREIVDILWAGMRLQAE
ncbi:TetR/AcrR family transcriptional regulator [Alicyclobacillus sp. SO9]|uniref:TetR/AcrR family transcriptional regulator n=1 Tax=Alicyclobacillus sp. SO9 TaxID=2665646 RepID=UPI0018E73BA3|nr:TetR/AcrR family transcriptional regulator [Alicyclobacillus sp. SO9]